MQALTCRLVYQCAFGIIFERMWIINIQVKKVRHFSVILYFYVKLLKERITIQVLSEKFVFEDNALSYCTPGRFYVMIKRVTKHITYISRSWRLSIYYFSQSMKGSLLRKDDTAEVQASLHPWSPTSTHATRSCMVYNSLRHEESS